MPGQELAAAPPRPALRAVTFEFWDTLVAGTAGPSGTSMRRLQIDRFAATLDASDRHVPDHRLARAFDANWERFEERWIANTGQYTPADTVDFVATHVGIALDDGLRERLVDGFRVVGVEMPLQPAAGIAEALGLLRQAGLRLGIVCDVGLTAAPTLRERLRGFGLLDAFDAWAFSDETGWFKPAPEAFAPALEGMGLDRADAVAVAHVGDNPRTDVVGALGLGMIAVRYTGFRDATIEFDTLGEATQPDPDASDDPDPPAPPFPEAHHVIDDHRSLPGLLGVT
ncbi:HAD family hydrolase [soil metagenome]